MRTPVGCGPWRKGRAKSSGAGLARGPVLRDDGRMKHLAAAALLAAIALAAAPARAGDQPWLGTWRITGAQPAPWVGKGDHVRHASDIWHLVGRTVVYRKARIDGPAPLACRGPKYERRVVGPDYLFQGGLTAPAEQARALGFSASIVTLETGCEGAIDFHFTDPATALFALDNMIYMLRRR